ncbi:MAG: hypothetical protein JRJ23_05245 [Deltaproteobacteria bacterium]|nr:hypothetical protein [Deltaproteobacteria bacterium]MBW1913877.1 hypothetical protein [Deltaproteobacteria bacterium]
MNIAISIAITGGIGGIERNIFTVTRALRSHSIDIYTMQYHTSGFDPRGDNVRIRWFEQKRDKLHVEIDDKKEYDLYFYYAACHPVYIGDYLNVKKKIVVPNGNNVREIEHYFDYVFCQAEDGIRYFDDMSKKLLITPCVIIPVDHKKALANLPEEFFLTVFNPYDRICKYDDGMKPYKGYDILYEMADHFPMPLIWCHSDQSISSGHNILDHPNIIHMHDLNQEQLYYLYEHATAYVSFSREESFGWSLADAIMFDKPIISKRVGVISSLDPEEKGLYLYKTKEELKGLLQKDKFEKGEYDKSPFAPERFEKKLLSLTKRE